MAKQAWMVWPVILLDLAVSAITYLQWASAELRYIRLEPTCREICYAASSLPIGPGASNRKSIIRRPSVQAKVVFLCIDNMLYA